MKYPVEINPKPRVENIQNLPDTTYEDMIHRSITTQTAHVAFFMTHEHTIRERALKLATDISLAHLGRPEVVEYLTTDLLGNIMKVKHIPQTPPQARLFFLLTDRVHEGVSMLQRTSTPVGMATLPELVNMFQYPSVLRLYHEGHYAEAMTLFRNEYVARVGLSASKLTALQTGGWVLGVTSAAITAYQIARSEAPAEELVHQSTLIAGGIAAGYEAGQLAIIPCGFTGPAAPYCAAIASLAGGILGTEIAEQLHQWAKSVSSERRAPSMEFQASIARSQPTMRFDTSHCIERVDLTKDSYRAIASALPSNEHHHHIDARPNLVERISNVHRLADMESLKAMQHRDGQHASGLFSRIQSQHKPEPIMPDAVKNIYGPHSITSLCDTLNSRPSSAAIFTKSQQSSGVSYDSKNTHAKHVVGHYQSSK